MVRVCVGRGWGGVGKEEEEGGRTGCYCLSKNNLTLDMQKEIKSKWQNLRLQSLKNVTSKLPYRELKDEGAKHKIRGRFEGNSRITFLTAQ